MSSEFGLGGLLPKHAFLQMYFKEMESFAPVISLLDVGCGYGYTTVYAKGKWPKARVVGLDLNAEYIETAQREVEEEGVDVMFTVGDCMRLPYQDGEFDVVMALFTTRFAPFPMVALREVFRVAKSHVLLGESTTSALGRADVPVNYYDTLEHFVTACPHDGFTLLSARVFDPISFYAHWLAKDLMPKEREEAREVWSKA